MKKLSLLLIVPLIALSAYGQTYEYETRDNLTGGDFSIVKDLTPVTVGTTASQAGLVDIVNPNSPFNKWFCLIAYNNGIGTPVTARSFNLKTGTNNITARRVLQISGDYFILFSYTDGSGVERFAVLRYNTINGIVWKRYFNGSLSGSQNTVDMDYDGSSYLYIVGDFPSTTEDLWVAKMNLSGSLIWYYTYADNNNTTDEIAWNIHYRNDSGIYIGATTTASSTDQAGLIVQIRNNGNVVTAKKIRFFPYPATPQWVAERLYVKSSGSTLYAVGLSYRSGPKSLFVATLNTSLGVTACSIWDATFFRLQPEFRLVNGNIVVAGSTDPQTSQTQSYINQFYSMSTTNFVAAARYRPLVISNSGQVTLSNDPNNYNIFNTANIGNSTGRIYRIKGHAGTGVTECDTVFTPDSLSTDTAFFNFTLIKDTVDAPMDSVQMKVTSFSPTDTLICDTGTSAHRMMRQDPVTVYPNPFTNELHIVTGDQGPLQLILTGIDGRELWRREYENEAIIDLSLGNLKQGAYLLTIMHSNGTPETWKIIKE